MADSSRASMKNDSQNQAKLLSVRGAIIAGTAGGLVYGVNYGLQALVVVLRMTGATGFISGFTVPLILALASQVNKEWGTATVAWGLYSLLAVPTLLMGSPGAYKVVVGLIGGVAYDLGYCGTGLKRKSLFLALVLYVVALATSFYIVYIMGIMPKVSGGNIWTVLGVVSAVFLFEGTFSTWLAIKAYEKRIKHLL